MSSSQSAPTSRYYDVPVRFASSHGIENPGFRSHRRGLFWHENAELGTDPFSFEDGVILGTPFRQVSLHHRGSGTYLLALEFVAAVTMDEAEDFVRRLKDAFTVAMAPHQRDAWYGNLHLEAVFSGLRDSTPTPPDVFAPKVLSTGLTSEELIPLNETALQRLTWSPLTTLFAEGMRASQPKSKFLFWFVILEELETRDEFQRLFEPLFSEDEKTSLRTASLSPAARSRLDNLLNSRSATRKGRPEKLLAILKEIGIGSVPTLDGERVLDEAICRSLITQRNNIAHKGGSIDEVELYTVLFPLAQYALDYLLKQQS